MAHSYLAVTGNTMPATEEYCRIVTERISDVIAMTDSEGLISWITPSVEPVSSYKPEERVGRPVTDHVDPEDRQRMLGDMQELARGRTLAPTEYRFQHKNG